MTPAPHFRRILATIFDFIIVTAAANVLCAPLFLFVDLDQVLVDVQLDIAAGVMPTQFLLGLLALFLVTTLLTHLYFIAFEIKRGATPGKMIVNLKVISNSDMPLTRQQAILRELMRWYIDMPFFPVAFVFMLATRNHERFGDRVAKTRVVLAKA